MLGRDAIEPSESGFNAVDDFFFFGERRDRNWEFRKAFFPDVIDVHALRFRCEPFS
jgi:hypothetical protein